ncbi:hypothetical protein [Cellulomonas cellasea]|uniref:Uncharacterized protein n=1 Tax=Cellulomonas cellasea TaxID=43670 RepID=A0A7W4YCG4_9CELL|nr:hypothetical protein [Cellulomonas cellasea]MBB2923531.1 hypothetical protein [Cellulomonas cellasea]
MDEITDERILLLADRLHVTVRDVGHLAGLLRIVEGLRSEGFVIVLKWDGQRDVDANDNGPYTALVTRGGLEGEFFRRDDESLEGALEDVLAALSERWAQS